MGFLGLLGIFRGILGPVLAAFMSFVNTPIGAGVTAGVASHYVTKWSVQRKERIACDAKAAKSRELAFDLDKQIQTEMLMRQVQNEREIARLNEEAAKKDAEYEKALADAEAAAPGSAACRRATDADDRRLFPHRK